MAPSLFNTAIDFMMGRTVARSMVGVSVGNSSFSDMDYADDVVFLAEFFDVLTSALDIMNEETHTLGLQISWKKTKLQAMSDLSQPPPYPTVIDGETVELVEKFNYLGSIITTECTSEAEINRRTGIAYGAMSDLDTVWRDRHITRRTKLRLYNALVLPILLYASETWTLTDKLARKLDAFDTKSLRRIEGLFWYDFVRNDDLRDLTKQPPITSLISQRRLQLFGHLARQDPPLEPVEILRQDVPHGWKRPRGRPRKRWQDGLKDDLKMRDVSLEEAYTLALDRPGWRSLSCAATPFRHAPR